MGSVDGAGDRRFIVAARVFALSGFAIARPLLDILAQQPAFFSAHEMDAVAILALGVGLIAIPATVLFGAAILLRAPVVVGVLFALASAPYVTRAVRPGLVVTAAVWM